jgi:transcription elongation factor Elf1
VCDFALMLLLKEISLRSTIDMPETEVKNAEIPAKPKCLRCGAEHTVSDLGHWAKGWWTCAVCNIRWEEDIFD